MTFTKPLDDMRVGGEIDAQCTKCRRPTNHRIVSMMEGAIKHVVCLTCESRHNYRPPAPAKPKAAPKPAA
jgi:hypothetical protein